MSIEMPEGLQWLSYLAGASWPKGQEDPLFALGDDFHTASSALHDIIDALHVACNTALVSYSGDGEDKMKAQFDQFFTGDQSVEKMAEQLKQLGDSVRQCGTQIEYSKLQIIITLAILAAEIAYALATMWGAWAVPAMEAEAAGVCQLIGQRLATFLANRATRLAAMPLWKLAAITGLEQAAIGFGTDFLVQAIQQGKGHRDGFDVKQLFISGAVGGISGAVAAPVGSLIGKGLGNWVGRDSMTWWKAGGIAIGAGIPAGVVGAGAGLVANGVFTGQWEFDPAAILGGVGGGLVGGVHGVAGHAQSSSLAKGGYMGVSAPPPIGADGTHERPEPKIVELNEGDGGSSRASSLYDGEGLNSRAPSVHSTSDRSDTGANSAATHNGSTTEHSRQTTPETNVRTKNGSQGTRNGQTTRNDNQTTRNDNSATRNDNSTNSTTRSQSSPESRPSSSNAPAQQPAASSRTEGQSTQTSSRTGIDPNSGSSQTPTHSVNATSTNSPVSQSHVEPTSNVEGSSNHSTTQPAQTHAPVEQPRFDSPVEQQQQSHVENIANSATPQSNAGFRPDAPPAQSSTGNTNVLPGSTPPAVTSSRADVPPPPASVTDKASVSPSPTPPPSPRPSLSSVGDGSRTPITAGVRTDPITTNQRAVTSSPTGSQNHPVESVRAVQDHPSTQKQPGAVETPREPVTSNETPRDSDTSRDPNASLGPAKNSGDFPKGPPEEPVSHPPASISHEQNQHEHNPDTINERPSTGLEFVPEERFNPTQEQVAALPGYRLQRITADGDCLFRAVDHVTGGKLGPGHEAVREKFSRVLQDRKDRLIDKFVPDTADFREAAREITRLDANLRDYPDHPARPAWVREREFRQWDYEWERSEEFDRQLEDLSKPGRYNNELGDFLIPEGADAHSLNIVVVNRDGTMMRFGPQDGPEHVLVRVDESGGHYHVAEPIREQPSNDRPDVIPDGSTSSAAHAGTVTAEDRPFGHNAFESPDPQPRHSTTTLAIIRPDGTVIETSDGSSHHSATDEASLQDSSVHAGSGDRINPITAAAVPGSDFHGHVEAPTTSHIDEVRTQVDGALRDVIAGHGGLQVAPIDAAKGQYRVTDTTGVYGPDKHSFEVRVETQRIGDDTVARSILNHDKAKHVIQISDRISTKHIPRALAHEIGEIVADRKRYLIDRLDAFGPDEGVLRPGAMTGTPHLTPHDTGRIQELRVLGEKLDELPAAGNRTPEERNQYNDLHHEAMALVEHVGLREGTPGAEQRRNLILDHLESSPTAGDQVRRVLDDAATRSDQLTSDDRRLLRQINRQAGTDRATFETHRADLQPAFKPPIADDGARITPDRARELADESTQQRAQRSEETLADLREKAAGGQYPKLSVIEAGGGAALAARDPAALLVDDRGRWQSDNGDRIAQTADQLRNLRQTGLGDPYQFVGAGRPDARVPLDAVRYWEDSIAAQGPVVDGKATFRMDNGKLLADITPIDGTPRVTVEVDGIPVIATGFPPEIIPGIARGIGGMHGTFDTATRELGKLNTPEADTAKAQIEALSWRETKSAGDALKILSDNNIDHSTLPKNVTDSLNAIDNWKTLREDYPGRVLSGDDANLAGVKPELAKDWIVAGTGGTGISGVENMLKLSTDAKFTMIGRNAPDGLGENPQWKEVRSTHDLGYDPKNPTAASDKIGNAWPNPTATGRLTMAFNPTMNIGAITELPGDRFSVAGFEGDGIIASLGTRNAVPPAVADLVDTAIKRDPDSVSAKMLFDNDGQYLGYRITADDKHIDVTGAASRFFPGGQLFKPGTGTAPPLPVSKPGTIWTTNDSRYALSGRTTGFAAQTASNRDAPPEGGNFDGGYVSSATQATHYAAWRRGDTTDASHDGSQRHSQNASAPAGSGNRTNPITAAAVPGSDFHGHVEAPTTSHIDEVHAQVDGALRSAVDGHGGLQVDPIDAARGRYRITDNTGVYGPDQKTFEVRVETQRIGDDTVARSILNHDKGQHVIQISDRISTKHIPRALAHEIGEIVADRQRYVIDRLDSFGPDEGVLRPGAVTGTPRLTPHDAGRIQELRALGEQLDGLPAPGNRTPEERNQYNDLHREAMALVEHVGLRDGTPGAEQRRNLVLDHLDPTPASRDQVRHLLDDAATRPDQLTSDDRRLLRNINRQAGTDRAAFEAHRADLQPAFKPPIADDGARITPDRARELADESTALRAQRSEQTLADLREKAADGEYPKLSVIEAGGGAALAARDPAALLVDDRGRWQSDNGDRIAQTADQLRNLRQTGLGDPYQFVGTGRPDARVPLDAVRYWEDSIAAQGPVVNGKATFRMENGKLLADITPIDGTPRVTVEVDGTPVIATGFPPEIIPGIARGIGGMHGTFDTTARELGKLNTSGADTAKTQIEALSWRDTSSAGEALKILTDNNIDHSTLPKNVTDSLHAIDNWKTLRENYPGRVLSGDDANLRGVKPELAKDWIVAGTGGTGISGVENMLKLSTDAKFTMIGRNAPDGLAENPQWKEVRSTHDLGYDPKNPTAASQKNPDGTWPNPTATGRLTMAFNRTMNIGGITELPGGRFSVAGFEGDGVIASLGTRNAVPPAVADLVDTAIKRDPDSVSAKMLFDNDGQYLGYRITADGRHIDVTGAASRFFPGGQLFKPGTGSVPPLPVSRPGTVWSTNDSRYALSGPATGFAAQTASNRDAPPEGGNFDGGYVSSATQATHYAAWRRGDATDAPHDGSQPHPQNASDPAGSGNRTNPITAAAVPGSDFRGHVEAPTTSHIDQVHTQVDGALRDVIAGHGGLQVDPIDAAKGQYRVTDTSGVYGPDQHSFEVRVETQRIGDDTVARSILNHDKAKHVIQISDRISTKHIPRALAHEIGEIVADRKRYIIDRLDAFGPDEGVLHPGAVTGELKLTPHDTGRIQELRVLGERLDRLPSPDDRTPEQRNQYDNLHHEAMALVEHVGLRDGTPGAEQRRNLVLDHLESSPTARDQVRHLLDDAGTRPDQLTSDDRRLLRQINRQAGVDRATFETHRADLQPAFKPPIADDGARITPDRARELADESTQQRAQRSEETLADLREKAAGGQYPKLSVIEAGGGAALAARDPAALLVDDRGRWQSDNGDRIAQTADQLRNLRQTGLGDPYQFVGEGRPDARVPLDAVRYWEDSIAAQGPVVDGKATFRMENGKLLADITPIDDTPRVTVEVDGIPVIATGFPPEIIPGIARGIGGMHGTFDTTARELGKLNVSGADTAKAQIEALSWRDTASAGEALKILSDNNINHSTLPKNVTDSLNAINNWKTLRKNYPGRVLSGDDANLRGVKPELAKDWIVAGTGGTGISGVENMLKLSTDAKFTMIGRNAPDGLGENPQWKEVRSTHDLGYDPKNPTAASDKNLDGTWPNPNATGRLTMAFDRTMTIGGITELRGGRFSVAGFEGDGVIASLGTRNAVPPAVADLVDTAIKRDPNSVSAKMLFDNDGQYLGYRITVDDKHIDVTGAASRFFPGGQLFKPGTGDFAPLPASKPGTVWSTGDSRYALSGRTTGFAAQTASNRDAPPEGGNFDGGYVASATQATHYAAWRRGDTTDAPQSHPQNDSVPAGSGDPVNRITAAAVPGSDFHGHVEDPTTSHIDQIHTQVDGALRTVIDGHGGLHVDPIDAAKGQYRVTDTTGVYSHDQKTFEVRVETQRIGDDTVARSILNHDKAKHVIQISDRISTKHIPRALAHEIGEIVADRKRYLIDRLDAFGPDEGILHPDGPTNRQLTPHDAGRIQELRVLGEQLDDLPAPHERTPEEQTRYNNLHREAMALVDHMGLREGTPGADQRRALALDQGGVQVSNLLNDAGGHPNRLTPDDRQLLQDIRDQAREDRAALDAHRKALRPTFERPIAFNGKRATPDQTRALADESTRQRAERSEETLADLREKAAGGQYPKLSLIEAGGGAALAARDPAALLVDDRGRWQSDNGDRIAQTADQLRNLRQTGLGDPYQFVGAGRPDARVPLDAVRYWEDSIAAQGPVVDGKATFRMDNGKLLADITPIDGTPRVTVEVDGIPVIATGFPPEIIPGIARGIGGMHGTFDTTARELGKLNTPEADTAKTQIEALSWRETASAGEALKILSDNNIEHSALPKNVTDSLNAINNWKTLRKNYPDRVLSGDDANLAGVNPDTAKDWIVAGTGGTGISGVENMLKLSTDATFTMIGRNAPDGLAENPQWKEVRSKHDFGYDPKNPTAASEKINNAWPNPTATGRLTMAFDRTMTIGGITEHGGRFSVAGFEGDGVIASLGTRNSVPPAVADLVDTAIKRDPNSVSAKMLFDNDGQYLGYRITVDNKHIDVTGAASRFFPGGQLFKPGTGDFGPLPASKPGTVWSTGDSRYALSGPTRGFAAQTASTRDAPPEGGNFDGGYVASAVQATHYAAWRRGGVTDPTNLITAAAVPGSDFHGHVEAPATSHIDQVRTQVDGALHSAVEGHGGLQVAPIDAAKGQYRITDTTGVYSHDQKTFEVRVETQRIGDDTVARSILNHDKAKHVIQISDRISTKHIPRALAHEIGEIVADRKRYLIDRLDAFGPDEGILRPGTMTGEPKLTPHDTGRIQELRTLGEQLDRLPAPGNRTPEEQTRYDDLHREAMALVEHGGLREGTPGAEQRRNLILDHLESSPTAGDQVRHLLDDAGTRPDQLTSDDRRLLQNINRQAGTDRAAFEAHRDALRPTFERPIAFNGERATPDQTRALADQSTRQRAQRSQQTLANLRQQAATSPDEYPKLSVIEAGGGAALAARDPAALLVDDRGRWQSDNGDRIAQTADQLRNLRQTGLGDPYQFVGTGRPDARVPLDAVRYWEDSIAAQGPVVDGKATFRMENGKLLADITPIDDTPRVTVEVDGIPVIATGFPPEIIPGIARGIGGMHGTFDTTARELGKLNTPEASTAKNQIEALSWRDTASAGEALKILSDNNINHSTLPKNVTDSLNAINNWKTLRKNYPGRVLSGDDANLRGVKPELAKDWIVAGTGGTGISGVENMLKLSTDAKFTMIGRNAPDGLGENPQWKEVRSTHDLGYDPKNPTAASDKIGNAWPNPTATGRLTMAFNPTMNIGAITELPGDRFSVAGFEGDGIIASLGTRNAVPPAVADLVDTAIKRDPNSVSAEMLFDNDGQYLGYRITVDGRDIDVTGAASRFFPGGQLFNPGTGTFAPLPASNPGSVWTTNDSRYARTASGRDAPPEGGNFDGGYVASATQATHYAAWRRGDGSLP
ncbi:hypothetical protein OG203_37835 [Nocardia sp. NBC_01499]|uniref:WXG100-like domain-containing protein n=1 Tax=Nocardia sp. NBC_01499 TaxID=2903597 RepID=UPI00386FB5BF